MSLHCLLQDVSQGSSINKNNAINTIKNKSVLKAAKVI